MDIFVEVDKRKIYVTFPHRSIFLFERKSVGECYILFISFDQRRKILNIVYQDFFKYEETAYSNFAILCKES